MGRTLATTTLIAGVVYEAGTDEADIEGAGTVSADVWDGEPDSHAPQGTVGVSVAEVAALRERYDAELAERDATIDALKAEIELLKAAPAEPARTPVVDYSGLDTDALKAEIDRRNEGRDDADRIGKRGGVETLAAALVADDKAGSDRGEQD